MRVNIDSETNRLPTEVTNLELHVETYKNSYLKPSLQLLKMCIFITWYYLPPNLWSNSCYTQVIKGIVITLH